jgi:hypothetical protein
MSPRGRKEKPIDRDAGPWHAFIDDLRKLRGKANLTTVGQAMGYSASHLSRSLDPANRDLSEDFVRAYARACDADPDEWARRRAEALRAVQAMEASAAEAVRDARPEDAPRAATADTARPEETPHAGPGPDPEPEPETAPILLGPPGEDTGGRTTETLAAEPRSLLRLPGVIALAAVGLAVLIGVGVSIQLFGGGGVSTARTTDVTTPEPLTEQCRSGWAPMRKASLYVMPCIERGTDGVIIYAKVKAMSRDGVPDEATVWLWLMHQDQEAIDNRTFQLTRDESTLRRCRVRLKDADQVETCGPFTLPAPAKQGVYATASQADLNDAVHPPGWHDPTFSGTQGGSLHWRKAGQ